MTPTRSRKPVARVRPRSEVVVAVAVAVGIVLATVFLVWALRPGTAGVPGTGGIMSRQPRVSLLIVVALLVLAIGLWWVFRRRGLRRFSRRVAALIVIGVVLIASILVAIFWPGGVVRDYPSAPTEPQTPTTVPPTAPQTNPRTPTTNAASPTGNAPTPPTAKP
jgi:hypothetical protein